MDDPIAVAAAIERAKTRAVLTEADGTWTVSLPAHGGPDCGHAIVASGPSVGAALIAAGRAAKLKGRVCRPVIDRVMVDGRSVEVHA